MQTLTPNDARDAARRDVLIRVLVGIRRRVGPPSREPGTPEQVAAFKAALVAVAEQARRGKPGPRLVALNPKPTAKQEPKW